MVESNKFLIKANSIHFGKYEYISILNNLNKKIKIICPMHGEFQQLLKNHLYRKSGCPSCANKNITHAIFLKRAIALYNYEYEYLTLYKTRKSKIKIKHILCNNIFYMTPDDHLSNHGCPNCYGKFKKSFNDLADQSNKIHNNKYTYVESNFKNIKEKICIICTVHGEFMQSFDNHIHSMQGCPKCNSSKGELFIRTILKKYNIKFIEQFKFENCINPLTSRQLSFDFYLTELNIIIEYDGIQHYKPIKIFGGEEAFKKQQINDLIKDQYCSMNNIKLIRISKNNIRSIE